MKFKVGDVIKFHPGHHLDAVRYFNLIVSTEGKDYILRVDGDERVLPKNWIDENFVKVTPLEKLI